MEDLDNKKAQSRRDFLEVGATAAVGVALGLAVSNLIQPEQEAPEMVKMLTADGKLVLIEKRLLPPMCGKPVKASNQEILEWMEKSKL